MNVSEYDVLSSLVRNSDSDDWMEYPYDVGKLHFPRDEGVHDFAHEWWYLNLHLINLESGKKYDVMVSYFPKQEELPFPMRYFMITDQEKKLYSPPKKFNFGSVNISDEKQEIRFRKGLRFDSWVQLETKFAFEYQVKVNAGSNGLYIVMRSWKPPLPVGGTGYVPVGTGGYSYYYSLTRLNVAGFLKIDRRRIPVVGKGWVDHQFGDYHQTEKTETYEWFCIQLDNNVDIICWYTFVEGKLTNPIMTYMFGDNSVETPKKFTIETLDYWLSPKLRKYGSKWRITEPKRKLDVTVSTVIPNQLAYMPYPYVMDDIPEIYLVGLYEGSTMVEGSYGEKPIRGVGYAELTHTH